jgi:hypothetical protein
MARMSFGDGRSCTTESRRITATNNRLRGDVADAGSLPFSLSGVQNFTFCRCFGVSPRFRLSTDAEYHTSFRLIAQQGEPKDILA